MGNHAKHMKIQRELDSGERVTVKVEYQYSATEQDFNKTGLHYGLELPAMPRTKTTIQDAIELVAELHKNYFKFQIIKAGIWDFGTKRCEHCNGLGVVFGEGFYIEEDKQ